MLRCASSYCPLISWLLLSTTQLVSAIAADPSPEQPAFGRTIDDREADERSTIWAEGNVRDKAGKPIRDSEVIARGVYQGALRQYELVVSTLTDSQGHWRLLKQRHLSECNGFLIASKSGYPYVATEFQNCRDKQGDQDLNSPERLHHDFVLPAHGSRLDVLVTQRGKPVSNVAVSLCPEQGPAMFVGFYVGASRTIAREHASKILYPVAMTDAAGAAHFTDIPDGIYTIIASEGGQGIESVQQHDFRRNLPGATKEEVSQCRGIALTRDSVRAYHLELGNYDNVARFALRQPDGDPFAGVECEAHFSRNSDVGYRWRAELDDKGVYSHSFYEPGIWRASYVLPDPRRRELGTPDSELRSTGLVAVSQLLHDRPPVLFTARQYSTDKPEPGSFLIDFQKLQLLGELLKTVDGVVMLPAGKQPAPGARIALFMAGSTEPDAIATVNHAGRFSLVYSASSERGLLIGRQEPIKLNAPNKLDGPTLVAWAPGKHGPTILSLSNPMLALGGSILLPKSLALRGKVTIGGRTLSSQRGLICVFAERQGDDPIRELFHRTCDADADGNFELTGLTAGVYHIQATLDNIWLSPSSPVKIAPAGDQIAPLALNIKELGGDTLLMLVDKQGQPLVDVDVTVLRPPGPLARRCWPEKLTSDAAGAVYIPPLEVGAHKIQIVGYSDAKTITVPKLGAPNIPANLTITLDSSSK
jgi:hypothetical protein